MRSNPLLDRFASKVDRSGECWEWTGAKDRYGRGMIHDGTRLVTAPRIAWLLSTEKMPPADKYVCHSCDNPSCVNPAHLWLGTNSENMLDAFRKGRIVRPRREAHPNAKLTMDLADEIRSRYAAGGMTKAALAREYGLSAPVVSQVTLRRCWMSDP